MVTALRRLFWLAALGGAGFAGWSLWNSSRGAAPTGSAQPPPRTSVPPRPSAGPIEAAERVEPAAPQVDPTPAPQAFVAVAEWVAPVDGACPASHPVKANDNSGIFHVPGGRFYDRTRPERCYATPEAATADGYRAAKS